RRDDGAPLILVLGDEEVADLQSDQRLLEITLDRILVFGFGVVDRAEEDMRFLRQCRGHRGDEIAERSWIIDCGYRRWVGSLEWKGRIRRIDCRKRLGYGAWLD